MYSIKGGVGKTAAAVNLAYLAARDGEPSLLWDLDPQGAATFLLRVRPKVKGGARAIVRRKRPVDSSIKSTDFANFDLVPADLSYRHLDLALDRTKKPTEQLADILRPLADEYSYVFLDCAPSMSLVSESIFGAADVLLVPTIPTTLSVRTLEQLGDFLGNGATKAKPSPPRVDVLLAGRSSQATASRRDGGTVGATGRARGGCSVRDRGRADGHAPSAGRRVRALESRRALLRGSLVGHSEGHRVSARDIHRVAPLVRHRLRFVGSRVIWQRPPAGQHRATEGAS